MSYNVPRLINKLSYEIDNRDELTFLNSNESHIIPKTNTIKIYSKDNNDLYLLNDLGVETIVGGGGGGGGDVFGPSSSTNDTVAFFDGITGKLLKENNTIKYQTGVLITPDIETSYTFSLNDELKKIQNITTSTPNITNYDGLIKVPELAVNKIYDTEQNILVELDTTSFNVNSTEFNFNGSQVLTTDDLTILNDKTKNIPIEHNPFIYTDTEPINSNENRVYLDDELNLYSGSYGDGSYPKQADLPTYNGTFRNVSNETELDAAIALSADYDIINITQSFFITSSKNISKKLNIRGSIINSITLTFASLTQIFLITSSNVKFSNLTFNNLNTGSNATILNFNLLTGVNNFVNNCIFETNEFAITSNNTNIQIMNNTFKFVGTPDSHRYISLTGCLGSSFIVDNIFEGNGIASTQCIFISNIDPTNFSGNLIIKNNISQVQPVQRLLMIEQNMTGSNFSLYVSSNTITTTSGFIILYYLPLDGIKQIYLYNNTEILASGITGSKGIIGLDSPASSVISFNTKIYSSRNTIPNLREDYTDLINPQAEQPRVIAYATLKFNPAQLYDLTIPFITSLAGGTTDLTALETKTQNITSNGIDLTTINGNLTTDSLTSETLTNGLLTSSIALTTGAINMTSDALNFNGSSVLYNNFPSAIEATSFIKTGGTNLQYLLADGSTLTQSANSGNSNYYLYDSSTSLNPTPTAGLITYNTAVQANATFIYISHLTRDGIDIEVFFKQISVTTDVYIQDQSTSDNYIQYNITATPVITVDSKISIPVILRQGAGSGLTNFPNNHNVLLAFFTNSLEVDTRLTTLETKTQNIIDANVNQTSFGGSLGIIASAFTKSGGTASQFLKANGTIDSSSYLSASNAIITTLQTQNQNQIGTSTNTSFSGSGGVVADKFVKTDGLSTQFLKANGDSDSTSYLPQVSNILRYGGLKLSTLATLALNNVQTNVSVIPASISGSKSFLANEAIVGSSYSIHLFGVISSNDTASLTIEFLNSTHTIISTVIGASAGYSFGLRLVYTVRATNQVVTTGDWLIYSPVPNFIPVRNLAIANTTTSSTFDIKYTTNGTSSLVFSSSHLVLSKIG